MKHLASIALTAALAVGSLLSVALPASAAPFGSPSAPNSSNIILVQDHGTRWHPDSYDDRRHWRDRDRRHWRGDRGWDRRDRDRYWSDDRRYRHRHHSGVIFEIRP
ncbi:hypothetical protein BSK43_022525 [Rhizobium sp. P44RR-XXIV]|nr:hypothetical protein BSK43_022525 [Rhizobium sp. P44RR-XXIV]